MADGVDYLQVDDDSVRAGPECLSDPVRSITRDEEEGTRRRDRVRNLERIAGQR